MNSLDSKDGKHHHAKGKTGNVIGSSQLSPSNRTSKKTTEYEEASGQKADWWECNKVTLDMANVSEVGKRVEKLMGTSVVKFTDRKYMMQLQERILESHYESTERRMNSRMNEEIEREKRLILENKMPMDDAAGLSNHPVFVVRSRMATNPQFAALNASSKKRYARVQNMETAVRAQEEQEKRMDAGSRVKKKKKPSRGLDEKEGSIAPSQVSEDTEADQASMKVLLDLSEFEDAEAAGSRSRRLRRTLAEDGEGPGAAPGREDTMRTSASVLTDIVEQRSDWGEEGDEMFQMHGSITDQIGFSPSLGSSDESDSNCSLLSSGKETERIKYEAPLVRELRRAETVDQLYELAEQIVGPVPPCAPSK